MARQRLTHAQVAQALKERLYRDARVPGSEEADQQRYLTLTYAELSELSGFKQFVEGFYYNVRWEGWAIGINVAFGSYGVVVASDEPVAD